MCVSHLSCFCGRLIKGHFEVSDETKTPVDLRFCCIVTMEKVDTASAASDDAMKSLFDEFERSKDTLQKDFNKAKKTLKKDFNRDNDALGKDFERAKDEFDKAKDILRKAKNQIHEGFEELREDQDALAADNSVHDVDGSEILDINAGGVIMSVTRYTLTLIKGTRLEAARL